MSTIRFYISLLILAFSTHSVLANKPLQTQEPLSHDSIISLNEYALSLIYSNPDSANYFADLAYKVALNQKDSLAMAHSFSTIAGVNWAQARFNLSLKYYFDALNRYEILQDTAGVIKCYNNIAEVYKKIKNYPNAKRYLYKARELHNNSYLETYPVLNNLNLGELYLEEKNYDSAAFYLSKAKSAPNNELSVNYYAAINFSYAKINKDTANFDLAYTFIEQCIRFAKMAGNQRRLAEANNVLGEILFELNKVDEARVIFQNALNTSIRLKHEHLELKIHKNLYLLEFEAGNSIKAITHIMRYTELQDKIYTISIARQSAEFEAVYNMEQIEKENSFLLLKQTVNDSIIRYQIGFLVLALIALIIAVYLLLAINKQRKSLKHAIALLEEKSRVVEKQKLKIEKQAKNTDVLNQELRLLNKNLDSRAQQIAREIEIKNKKMNKYAFMNAHKLRAPIASILGLINLFDKDITNDDEQSMIIMLKESADNLDKVVHEIKDVIDE